jgi:hypothetical protein
LAFPEVLRFIAEQTGGFYAPFTERTALVGTLRQMVAQQGRQVAQPVPRPRSARRVCFLAALAVYWSTSGRLELMVCDGQGA